MSKSFRIALLAFTSGAAILALASCNKPTTATNTGAPGATTTTTTMTPAETAAPAAPADTAASEQTLHDLAASWAVAMNNKDVDATVRMYSDDAIFMPPDQPVANTADAIHQAWANLLATPGFTGVEINSTKLTVAGSNDMAVDVGTYKETVNDPASTTGPTIITGKYMTSWVKRNGEWKVVNDIFNTDAPSASTAAAGPATGAPMAMTPGSPMAPGITAPGGTTPGSAMTPPATGLAPADTGTTTSPPSPAPAAPGGALSPDTNTPTAPAAPSTPTTPQ